MIRRLAAVCLAAGFLGAAFASGAHAHPLGNFTINRYAGIELAGNAVYVHYVLDLAEIPTFQIGDEVRRRGYPRALARSLELRLDGRRAELVPLERRVRTRPGAGGLDTLRLDVVYRARADGGRLVFVDRAFRGRIGWREITLSARDGARIVRSDVRARSASSELRTYPGDRLRSPLDVRSAVARFVPGPAPAQPPHLGDAAAPRHDGGTFEALVGRDDLSVGVVLVSLLVAAFWGAAHALTPGHGKALVAGYLIGTRGRPRDAVLLGATVTATHTAGVFALGLVTLGLSRFVVPEDLYPWLTLVSGVLVLGVGLGVLRSRMRLRGQPATRVHGDDHDHGHGHDHGHDHDHERGGVLGVGIAAGLLPCPSALVVLLGAIALHRIGFGFALIVAFSVGLAATITGIGLVAVLARRAFARVALDGPVVRALPAVSAVAIVLVGAALTAKAIPGVL